MSSPCLLVIFFSFFIYIRKPYKIQSWKVTWTVLLLITWTFQCFLSPRLQSAAITTAGRCPHSALCKMSQSKSHLILKYITILFQFLTIPTSVPCEYPVISAVFYTEGFKRNRAPPELIFVNSSAHLKISKDFPYQFLLLNCSASYPIKWDTDLPKVFISQLSNLVNLEFEIKRFYFSGLPLFVHSWWRA